MAFSYTRNKDATGVHEAYGTYTSASGSTGGDIVTGLAGITCFLAGSGTSTPSTYATVSGGTATITTTANQTGWWMAKGY